MFLWFEKLHTIGENVAWIAFLSKSSARSRVWRHAWVNLSYHSVAEQNMPVLYALLSIYLFQPGRPARYWSYCWLTTWISVLGCFLHLWWVCSLWIVWESNMCLESGLVSFEIQSIHSIEGLSESLVIIFMQYTWWHYRCFEYWFFHRK